MVAQSAFDGTDDMPARPTVTVIAVEVVEEVHFFKRRHPDIWARAEHRMEPCRPRLLRTDAKDLRFPHDTLSTHPRPRALSSIFSGVCVPDQQRAARPAALRNHPRRRPRSVSPLRNPMGRIAAPAPP